MIRVQEEKPKCKFGHCDHSDEEHEGGTCWHIVKPELEHKQTLKKYCECRLEDKKNELGVKVQSIKSWADIEKHEGKGWMEPSICPKCVKNEDKQPTGLILVNINPRSKIGTPKTCSYCFGKGTDDIMVTMECQKCQKASLIRSDVGVCAGCQEGKIDPHNFFTGKSIEKTLVDAKTNAIAAQKLFDEKQEAIKAKEAKDHRNI
tara:strand:- start:2643 stop:3254 length:612 start_codon:yes stop_codon:yes gene_type:complete